MSPLFRKGMLIVSVAAVIALSVGLVERVIGRKRLRFPYLVGPIAAEQYAKLAAHPGWVASRIAVAPSIHLNGLVRRPSTPSAPWVLFYQGNDATMLERGQSFLEQLGAGRDWGLAVYAYRGYDSSEGTPMLSDLAADAPLILDQLVKTEQIELSRVHLVGFSIGGHLSTQAMAARGSGVPRPASLSLLAPADDIVMFRRSLYEKLDPGDDMQTRPLLDAVPAPVLVVQGGADQTLGTKQGKDIAEKLGKRAEYVEIPGAGHIELLSDARAIAATRDFITAHVK